MQFRTQFRLTVCRYSPVCSQAISYTHHAPVKSAGCADYLQQKSIVSWSTSVVNKCRFCPLAPVENGGGTEADMMVEVETWEQKEEPGEGEPGGGGALGGEGGSSEEVQGKEEEEMMEEEEEEELPMLKVIPLPPDAPKKEHVNVVFIGHVGAFLLNIITSWSSFLHHFFIPGQRASAVRNCLYSFGLKTSFLFFRCW